MIEALILFATLGIFAGLIAGMFGVGGGIITVPVLVACFIQYGFEEAIKTEFFFSWVSFFVSDASCSSEKKHFSSINSS